MKPARSSACNSRLGSEDHFELAVDALLAARPLEPVHPDTRLPGVFHTHPLGDANLSPLDQHFLMLTPFVWAVGAGKASARGPSLRFFYSRSRWRPRARAYRFTVRTERYLARSPTFTPLGALRTS